ncbi:spore coat associated protein CotJA [Desulfoscipio geothermicus]|uniref:Spore coat associated protein JA (CotJA) n=1 Tax=Desulfoscipio geothermicus DSM 3669 TaxID=1121426 RepID=A0A1I6E4W9_9FIRM|nr:spore coat associated protein CotJA [Desulfoscipio geothermicus]SFR12763.1 Spore coat associated protein JA (CotJA) [Desulfoscipio geothermicus DSM 3669]
MSNNSPKSPNPNQVQAVSNQKTENLQGYYPGQPYPGMELARAYIPIQRLGTVYPPARALEVGTLFPDLYRPYPY